MKKKMNIWESAMSMAEAPVSPPKKAKAFSIVITSDYDDSIVVIGPFNSEASARQALNKLPDETREYRRPSVAPLFSKAEDVPAQFLGMGNPDDPDEEFP